MKEFIIQYVRQKYRLGSVYSAECFIFSFQFMYHKSLCLEEKHLNWT